ncbi:RagB/SusD family nutrient uptake outer membrane protein [Pedobacter frigoris]|uniref:RagB/SusD family nutrient uptake outer membrane protein n=1 Tax=Pedobacter frigoris TaxID=2571272 RepID=UPI0029308712|nr:RagB/SusD family nutrient uptake outer membrane protein [Pedobacter frigoris]
MKTIFNKIWRKGMYVFLLTTIFITSCKKLDKQPLDALTSSTFFNTAADLRTYVNSMYNNRLPVYQYTAGTGNSNALLDNGSDFMIFSADITGGLNQVGATGTAGTENGTWSTGYTRIRQDNYFLKYALEKAEKTPNADHYIGEGYFFRAMDYFALLNSFGDVPIILEPLTEADVEKMYVPRSSRNEVAKQILKDLDLAIQKLYWKGTGEAVAGRVNKEAAIVLKARVALFEGTWEYYHSRRSTQFAVAGKDGREFLEMIEPAMNELISRQGTRIFKTGDEPYNQLFAQKDASSVDGVFLYRVYDGVKLNVSHNFFSKITDFGPSITDHLVDIYLNKDGSPQNISDPYTTLNTLSQNLDPRFRQTIWTPDRGPLGKLKGRELNANLRYPIVAPILSTGGGFTSTGYRTFKGAVLEASEFNKGETDDILIRYEEGLLALAEAKAILGTITQADLDKTVNVLRGRVGMANMTLSAVNGFPISIYKEENGFDLTESRIVNEIRRERGVELALEGFRSGDIRRWAIFEKVINGYKPKGAQLQEFLDYYNDPAKLTADGFNVAGLSFPLLRNTGSTGNVSAFPDGRINPYFKSPQFQTAGQGFFINRDRDYLTFVPLSQIQLYKVKGTTLTQNPGWN